jgi:hypothetical protein
MPGVLIAVWIALALTSIAVVAAAASAASRGLRTWRGARRLMSQLESELQTLERNASAAGEKAAEAGKATEELAAAAERLQHSLAELAVLRAAAAEASALPRSLVSLVPRK